MPSITWATRLGGEALRRDLGPEQPVVPWNNPALPGYERALQRQAQAEGRGPVIQEVNLIDLQVQGPEITHGREPPGIPRVQEVPEPAEEPVAQAPAAQREVVQRTPWDPEGRRRVQLEE